MLICECWYVNGRMIWYVNVNVICDLICECDVRMIWQGNDQTWSEWPEVRVIWEADHEWWWVLTQWYHVSDQWFDIKWTRECSDAMELIRIGEWQMSRVSHEGGFASGPNRPMDVINPYEPVCFRALMYGLMNIIRRFSFPLNTIQYRNGRSVGLYVMIQWCRNRRCCCNVMCDVEMVCVLWWWEGDVRQGPMEGGGMWSSVGKATAIGCTVIGEA